MIFSQGFFGFKKTSTSRSLSAYGPISIVPPQPEICKNSAFERERERSAHKALDLLLTAHSAFERERERSVHKAHELLLTAHSTFERERSAHKALELLLTAQSAFEREISSQGS